jgi:hypothetical protein
MSAELQVAVTAVLGVVVWLVSRFVVWIRDAPVSPDPWDAATEQRLHESDLRPLCTRCLCPHEELDWFCPTCGRATSPYTNFMPFLQNLSEGDVLRHGTSGEIPLTRICIAGYALCALGEYLVFAPIYWWRLAQNVRRIRRLRADPAPEPAASQGWGAL